MTETKINFASVNWSISSKKRFPEYSQEPGSIDASVPKFMREENKEHNLEGDVYPYIIPRR